MGKCVTIGICGGSGSGKTTVVKELLALIPENKVSIIEEDSYYKDQSDMPFEDRLAINYDHPSAFDHELMIAHIKELLNGNSIEKPIYDFEANTRTDKTVRVEPQEIIIVEGIMILLEESVRELLDIKVYVDTDADVRIVRRILRDVKERGRTVDSVILQYMSKVRPSHIQFVEPSKRYADIILPEGGHNQVGIDLLRSKITSIINHEEEIWKNIRTTVDKESVMWFN